MRKYDDAGVHPEFAVQICRVGAYFASRRPDTAPIGEYTFYGVFTFVDKDPLKSSDENRITDVDKTRFDLIPAPTPTPTVTP